MGGGAALWGGFASFFSIWQLCILQISPFFVAFIVGLYLAAPDRNAGTGTLRRIVPACIAYTAGFVVFYSLLIASGLSISRPLTGNIGSLRIVAGALILLVGLYLILADRIPAQGGMHRTFWPVALSLMIGVSFALVYSPCISPMLSEIMGLASQRGTAVEGWYLALCYGLGTSIALCLVSVALILFLRRCESVSRNARPVRNVCGIVLLALALMNMTGLMRHYKAFVLGFVL